MNALSARMRPSRWAPYMGQRAQPMIKGFPAETVGLSVLGALAAVGIDSLMNVTTDQIRATTAINRTSPIVKNVLPAFAVTTGVAAATWWLSGSKTAAFVIESVALLYLMPKLVAAIS